MKKTIFIVLITFACNISFGQSFSELAKSEFKTEESYKAGEKQVLMCANYLFENPANEAELNRLNSIYYKMDDWHTRLYIRYW